MVTYLTPYVFCLGGNQDLFPELAGRLRSAGRKILSTYDIIIYVLVPVLAKAPY